MTALTEETAQELLKAIQKFNARLIGKKATTNTRQGPASYRTRSRLSQRELVWVILYAKGYQKDKQYAEPLKYGYMPRGKLQKIARMDINQTIDDLVNSGRIEEFKFHRGQREGFLGVMYRCKVDKPADYIKLLLADEDNLSQLERYKIMEPEARAWAINAIWPQEKPSTAKVA